MTQIRFGTGANWPEVSQARRGMYVIIRPGMGACRILRKTSTVLTVRPRLSRRVERVARWIEDHLLFPLEDFLVAIATELDP